LSHPSRKITLGSDIYTHVSSIPNPKEQEAGEPQYKNLDMKIGQTDTVGGYLVTLAQVVDMTGRPETKELVLAAGAVLKVQKDTATFTANPIYTIDKSRRPGMIEANLPEQGLKFAFVNIEPEAGIIRIQAEITPPVNDWIVLKAIEKPFINLLWLGTFILTAGFGLSMYRRLKEQK
jgi:cytochrome c-type biogenesis protein CcmF